MVLCPLTRQAIVSLSQCDQKIDQNFAKFLDKVGKNTKISTSKLNLQVQNIYIEPHSKP